MARYKGAFDGLLAFGFQKQRDRDRIPKKYESSLLHRPELSCDCRGGVWDIHRVPLLLIRLKHNTLPVTLLQLHTHDPACWIQCLTTMVPPVALIFNWQLDFFVIGFFQPGPTLADSVQAYFFFDFMMQVANAYNGRDNGITMLKHKLSLSQTVWRRNVIKMSECPD